jgi:DedD protein
MQMTREERNKPQSRKGNGWLATLGGALVLIAVGFGVGLVAGTAYEEPELVAQHLAGRTTDVPLDAAEMPADLAPPEGDVAAAPPPAAAPLPEPAPLGAGALDEVRLAPPAAPAPAVAAVRPPAAGEPGFAIQVGAFGSEDTASQLADELGKRGFHSYVAEEGDGARFKVRVGPLASRGEAERVSKRLQAEHRLPTWILAAGAPAARAR